MDFEWFLGSIILVSHSKYHPITLTSTLTMPFMTIILPPSTPPHTHSPLNPFADADDTMFLEEYDIIPSIFGSGKLVGIPVPYLQVGVCVSVFGG